MEKMKTFESQLLHRLLTVIVISGDCEMILFADADDHQVAPLPFELVVLELAIKDVCQICSQLTKDLEALVYPALDALTKAVGPLFLVNVSSACLFL